MKRQKIAHELTTLKARSEDVTIKDDITFAKNFLPLRSQTLNGLLSAGFVKPSPVQLQNIPLGKLGLDLVIQSKAGTGKTAVFAVIALETLEFNDDSPIQCIVLAPTREIAIQIHEVIYHLGRGFKDLSVALCIGGIDLKEDKKKLSKDADQPPQIVVGSPGRIKQLIELNILKVNNIELLVLDEADKLMEEQFKIQFNDIYKRLPRDKQMIAASATYSKELVLFLKQYMQTPQTLSKQLNPSLDNLTEYYIECKAGHSSKKTIDNKLLCLKRILSQVKCTQCIVFTNYQSRAPIIYNYLNSFEEFALKKVTYLCALMSQKDRITTFENFRQSNNKLLVSTDVSARGIDIEGIDFVINFDIPVDSATYYHRVGRAGRFGLEGLAITLVADESIDQSLFKKSLSDCVVEKLTIEELENMNLELRWLNK